MDIEAFQVSATVASRNTLAGHWGGALDLYVQVAHHVSSAHPIWMNLNLAQPHSVVLHRKL